VFLAVVFALAGLAKSADLAGSRRAVREFGIPQPLAPLLGTLLPLGELAVSLALIVQGSERWGALAALVLLVAFMVAIAAAMRRGRAPDCHCFGQLHSAPAGSRTLLRNALLAGVAGFIVARGWANPGTSATGWVSRLSATALAGIGVGVVVVAVQAWFSWQLLRQQGRLLARLEVVEARLGNNAGAALGGLPVGAAAPLFALPAAEGGIIALEGLLGFGRPVMLVFADPTCGPCAALLPEVSRWQRDREDRVTIAVISRGSRDPNAISADPPALHVGWQLDSEVAQAYAVPGTPSAVLIGMDGRIAGPLAAGRDAIVRLFEQVLSLVPEASEQGRNLLSVAGAALTVPRSDDERLLNST
jgi:thiol-disulfide isomerase/thioredoxin